MDGNIYYNPEEFGLEIVAELDPNESYEFDTVVLFRDKQDGRLYLLHDSGCSCPTPFEDLDRSDLKPALNIETVERYVEEMYGGYTKPSISDVLDFFRKAKAALN